MELRFNLNGKARKPLVEAPSDFLGQEAKYLGAPTYSYQIGEYAVDRQGTLTGEDNIGLAASLAERGFTADTAEDTAADTAETAVVRTPSEKTAPELEEQLGAEIAPEAAVTADNAGDMPDAQLADEPTATIETAETDRLSLEYPLDGFAPEKLENLKRLVESKDVLIKEALGANELPIQILTDRIAFPWFPIDSDGDTVNAYSQFICALCDTAKKKSRVVAKAQESFENPRFTMRVWLIGLGLVGREFDHCRKQLISNFPGNSGFRYGKPEEGATPRRDGIHKEVISIRLTPDTLNKLSLLAAKAESESGQRTSRNMLIEGAVKTYICEAVGILETLEPEAVETETPESTATVKTALRTEFTQEDE